VRHDLGVADVAAFGDQRDAETVAILQTLFNQSLVARLEHVEVQHGPGKEHGLEREEAQTPR